MLVEPFWKKGLKMKIKLVRLFVSIFLGISMIGALLGMFQILPTMAQAQDCTGAILEACNDLDPQEVESETAVLAWLHADDETINPEQALADAYQRTLDAGSYEFTADSEQLLLPRPLPSMIGQTSQRVDMHVNGEVTLPDYSMLSVSLDGAGLNPAPVAIIQEGTNSYLLREGEKVPVENPAGLTSPTGDYLSYLAAAENVQACESDAAPFATAVACYTYQINGLKYAEHVRQQMQAQLSQTPGATSIGVEYEVSPILKQISGQGKIWLDANGLPLRQKIDMLMPEADERYDADIRLVIDYRFDEEAVASALAAASPFASFIPPVEEIVQTAGEALPNLAIFSFFMVITALLALLYRRRWIYGFIAILLTISYLATPLLQVININLFYVRQVHAAAEAATFSNTFVAPVAEESASAPVATQSLLTQSLTASAQAFEPDVYCGKGGNADRDGDGLADDAENCLGTNPNLADSDGDAINDGVEVAGFEFGQQARDCVGAEAVIQRHVAYP